METEWPPMRQLPNFRIAKEKIPIIGDLWNSFCSAIEARVMLVDTANVRDNAF